MQKDFHYYATYCAAYIAGYSHSDSLAIAYSAQFVDCCSVTLLQKIGAPSHAATTQLQLEMMNAPTDIIGRMDITRIWASFHFLPGDLYAKPEKRCSRSYLNKYRMICQPDGALLVDTVNLARGKSLQSAGVAMHVLADTWAHRIFAGTPSLVINNTNGYFYELIPEGDGFRERKMDFNHNPGAVDDPETGKYTNSLYQGSESSIMNLGHGRAGHLPDYSWARWRYMPAWGEYKEIIKDNTTDYMNAFCQMIYALRYLRGEEETFETGKHDRGPIQQWEDEITDIFLKRQLNSCADWKRLGEKLSGCEIEDFDIGKYQQEYIQAAEDEKDDTFLGKFIIAALGQKSMVTNRIFTSGNNLAGVSVDFNRRGFRGIKDFYKLVKIRLKETGNG